MLKLILYKLLLLFIISDCCYSNDLALSYNDPIRNKLYSKKKKIEISLPNMGYILNEPYVRTGLLGLNITYFFSETFGVGIDYQHGFTQDKDERTCIENFYNDPQNEISDNCGDADQLSGTSANFGPAYVGIRELTDMFFIYGNYSPIYGKWVNFLGSQTHYDIFFELGAGAVFSDYYPEKKILNNGKLARGTDSQIRSGETGASPSEVNSYGIKGRPDPEEQINPSVSFAIGQKFHFAKSFHLKITLKDMVILGTESGFENLISLTIGTGLRL